jgi:hypothetical protein
MQHYKHPTTGAVYGYEDLQPIADPIVTIDPETGEETSTPAPLCANDILVEKALEDGFVLMTTEEFDIFKNPPPTPEQVAATAATASKLEGIEFDGVMCSATMEDQNGLVAVITAYQLTNAMGGTFSPTVFSFANDNFLTITAENIMPFVSTWMPFRQSFFAPKA